MKNQQQGMIVLLAGPSGVGKNSLIDIVRRQMVDRDTCFSISATTRPPQEGEVDSVHYFFWTQEQFFRAQEKGEFIEYAQVGQKFYGTPQLQVEEALNTGKLIFMDLDCQGASQIRASTKRLGWKLFDAFISPPSMRQLEARLRGRCKSLPEDEIKARLTRAKNEMDRMHEFSYWFLNNDLNQCAGKIFDKIQLTHPLR